MTPERSAVPVVQPRPRRGAQDVDPDRATRERPPVQPGIDPEAPRVLAPQAVASEVAG